MTESDLEKVRAGVAASRHRVAVFETSVGRVAVKRPRPPRGRWRAHGVNALANVLALDMLRAVPDRGGCLAQAIEVARLRALAAAGICVPEVVHVEPGFIATRHLEGTSLVRTIERGSRAGFDAWRSGLATLVDVHARHGYLSQAFARNFIVTGEGLAMIDFEDDPLEVMSLDEAQARDWLAYLHSTAWLLDRDADEVRSAFESSVAQERRPVRERLATAGRRLSPLRYLPSSRRPWGREVVAARALAHLFALRSAGPEKMHA